jgi:hypothetical protein
MAKEKKVDEQRHNVTFYVDALTITNASTSANSMIQNFVQKFSKSYGEKAEEADKASSAAEIGKANVAAEAARENNKGT